jgi:hypothetical protein
VLYNLYVRMRSAMDRLLPPRVGVLLRRGSYYFISDLPFLARTGFRYLRGRV